MFPSRSFWSGRRVCVTGGSGFLGWHLVESLRSAGARVRVLTLRPAEDHPIHRLDDLETAWGDVRDETLVRHALADCSVIFHSAGVVGVWGKVLEKMWSVHVEGTRCVLEGAEPDATIIHTSSITTLGAMTTPTSIDESLPWNRAGATVPYVRAKRAAEALALKAAWRRHVVVTNPGYLIGPEDHEESIMGRLCERFWRGRAPLAPPGGVNVVDVRDAALGHLLAAERGQAGERYLLGGENHSFAALFRLLARAADLRPRGVPSFPVAVFHLLASLAELRAKFTGKEPYPSLAHAAMNDFFWFGSSAKAQAQLGYRPRPLQETLRDTFAWHRGRKAFSLRGFNRWWFRPWAKAASV